jgi:hypothetical protein
MVSVAGATARVRMQNVITLLHSAMDAKQPVWRAQYLADAQRLIGWALRSAVDECREGWVSWRLLAHELDMAHDTLYRQHGAGGPLSTGMPFYQAGTRNDRAVTRLVVGFRAADDGLLHVASYEEVRALMSFEVRLGADAPGPFRGRLIECYYRQVADGVSTAQLGRAAGFTLRVRDGRYPVWLSEPVFDELFGLSGELARPVHRAEE